MGGRTDGESRDGRRSRARRGGRRRSFQGAFAASDELRQILVRLEAIERALRERR